jgi:predicted kinase
MHRVSLGKLIIVVGLPGASKSTLLERKSSSLTAMCIDDFHANAINDSSLVRDSRHFARMIDALQTGHDCMITDIAFCEQHRRELLSDTVSRELGAVLVEWIFFENAPDKCIRNIRERNRPSLISDLAELDRLLLLYSIPTGVTPLPV